MLMNIIEKLMKDEEENVSSSQLILEQAINVNGLIMIVKMNI
jgi:hypothetical protein